MSAPRLREDNDPIVIQKDKTKSLLEKTTTILNAYELLPAGLQDSASADELIEIVDKVKLHLFKLNSVLGTPENLDLAVEPLIPPQYLTNPQLETAFTNLQNEITGRINFFQNFLLTHPNIPEDKKKDFKNALDKLTEKELQKSAEEARARGLEKARIKAEEEARINTETENRNKAKTKLITEQQKIQAALETARKKEEEQKKAFQQITEETNRRQEEIKAAEKASLAELEKLKEFHQKELDLANQVQTEEAKLSKLPANVAQPERETQIEVVNKAKEAHAKLIAEKEASHKRITENKTKRITADASLKELQARLPAVTQAQQQASAALAEPTSRLTDIDGQLNIIAQEEKAIADAEAARVAAERLAVERTELTTRINAAETLGRYLTQTAVLEARAVKNAALLDGKAALAETLAASEELIRHLNTFSEILSARPSTPEIQTKLVQIAACTTRLTELCNGITHRNGPTYKQIASGTHKAARIMHMSDKSTIVTPDTANGETLNEVIAAKLEKWGVPKVQGPRLVSQEKIKTSPIIPEGSAKMNRTQYKVKGIFSEYTFNLVTVQKNKNDGHHSLDIHASKKDLERLCDNEGYAMRLAISKVEEFRAHSTDLDSTIIIKGDDMDDRLALAIKAYCAIKKRTCEALKAAGQDYKDYLGYNCIDGREKKLTNPRPLDDAYLDRFERVIKNNSAFIHNGTVTQQLDEPKDAVVARASAIRVR